MSEVLGDETARMCPSIAICHVLLFFLLTNDNNTDHCSRHRRNKRFFTFFIQVTFFYTFFDVFFIFCTFFILKKTLSNAMYKYVKKIQRKIFLEDNLAMIIINFGLLCSLYCKISYLRAEICKSILFYQLSFTVFTFYQLSFTVF